MNFPKGLKYSKSHEWVRLEDDGTVRIGLTDYAQSELGDIVFVNLPETGDALEEAEVFADVESVKAVSDVYSPVSGVIEEINEDLLDNPQRINECPYEAWFVKAGTITGQEELLSAEEYEIYIKEEH